MPRKRSTPTESISSEEVQEAAANPAKKARAARAKSIVAKKAPPRKSTRVPVVAGRPAGEKPITAGEIPANLHEEIARLAYSYWEARGYQGGSPEEDWYRAEREIRSQIEKAGRR